MNESCDSVMDASVQGMRNSLYASRQVHLVRRLPPEVLGSCFVFLRLRDGVRASHVSRSWRAVALSTPRMWSNIAMRCNTSRDFDFITMALSRSGSLANLKIASKYPTETSPFDAMILPHLHKIRSLTWYFHFNIASLRLAAPFLEYLHIFHGMVALPHDFLGGQVGRLRSLRCMSVHLPDTCPVLSTVVELRIENLKRSRHAKSFTRLFDLCPRLESLTLSGLQEENAHLLPSFPSPTLRKISLRTNDGNYDLMQHFLAWNTANLRDVSLNMVATDDAHNIPNPFLREAVVLSIRKAPGSRGTWIVAEPPDGREHAVGVSETNLILRLAELVFQTTGRLQSIHTLNVDLDVLKHLIARFGALPALKRVTIHLKRPAHAQTTPEHIPEPQFPGWSALLCLKGVLDAVPRLESLIIYVWNSCKVPGCTRNAEWAKDVVWYLAFLKNRLHPPDILIRGFPAAAALRFVDLDGLPVRFETDEIFPHLYPFKYWPFKAKYR